MHRVNNVVIMQTEQLGHIESLEEEFRSFKEKVMEQDHVIAQLVGDNLKHLQDNMHLTAHINSLQERMAQLEHQLGQVGSVLMGMIEGAIEREGLMETSSSGSRGSAASGDDGDDQGGDMVNVDAGESTGEMRRDSPMPRETGLIAEMEREVTEAGLGGWFNGNPEDVLESWSGANSDVLASQDRVQTTLLTTIGGRTLPNPVRVPDNMTQPAVLRSLMEGPVRPWQCLVWSEASPPPYSEDLPPLHTTGLSHVLLQIGPYYEDLDSEYRGEVMGEEIENEGGDASVE